MIRLIVSPTARPGLFDARVDGDGATPLISGSRTPLADAARELLKLGYAPETMLTMRHKGSAHDSFVHAPIGQWAKVAYEEGPTGPRMVRWKPFPDGRLARTDESGEKTISTTSNGKRSR